MIKYYHTNLENNSLQEIKELEVGCWAYVQNPSKTELCKLAKSLEIEQKMMLSVLDQQEHPRFSENDTCKLLLLDVPVTTTDTSKPIITLPLAIFVIRDDYIVTVSLQQYTFIDHFISGDVASFWTQKKSRFVIQLIYQMAHPVGENPFLSLHFQPHIEQVQSRKSPLQSGDFLPRTDGQDHRQ